MSISALGSGLSGLQSYQRALDTTANNVANLDTNGFKPQQAEFQDIAGGGVNVSLSPQGVQQSAAAGASDVPSQTDPITETVNSLQYQSGFELSAQTVKSADKMLGTLINIAA